MIIHPTYVITGKNKQGELGSWAIRTEDEDSLNKILLDRGITAGTIDGKKVDQVKPEKNALKEMTENAIRSKRFRHESGAKGGR